MISSAIISANIKRERVADMGKYEYNFVEVPFDGDLKSGNAETIETVSYTHLTLPTILLV